MLSPGALMEGGGGIMGGGDKLILRGLKFHGFHGVLPEERILGQKFLIDVDAWMDLRIAGKSDCLSDTISYTDIYGIVKEIVEGPPHNLLESVAHLIASTTLTKFPRVSAVWVKVGKPHVAVQGQLDYLGVEILRRRGVEALVSESLSSSQIVASSLTSHGSNLSTCHCIAYGACCFDGRRENLSLRFASIGSKLIFERSSESIPASSCHANRAVSPPPEEERKSPSLIGQRGRFPSLPAAVNVVVVRRAAHQSQGATPSDPVRSKPNPPAPVKIFAHCSWTRLRWSQSRCRSESASCLALLTRVTACLSVPAACHEALYRVAGGAT
ncbi:hypothetical protein Tsubulata_001493 [Turnera subulata]|uniref:7,8-dihydroneopterin aldolase n=1 Tax=Turnera subulata TaxID=218843 RepID=A0A9Q0F3Q2_9ROSI|nr:hypothetical protein Tsubulata_001493 [Turnera subulata]